MSGALSVILAFAGVFTTAPHYKALFFVACALAVGYAAYRIWKSEREESHRLSQYLGQPHFEIEINQCYEFSQPPLKLLLRLHVVNSSVTATTIKGAKLEIIEDGRNEMFTFRESASQTATFRVPIVDTNHYVERPTRLEDILDQLEHEPLARGIHRAGDLIFIFDQRTECANPARVRLTLIDAFGNDHSTEQEIEIRQGIWIE